MSDYHSVIPLYPCVELIKSETVLTSQKDEPDAFKELGTGNRIATWLFYVSAHDKLRQLM